jgi:hypothetical protein
MRAACAEVFESWIRLGAERFRRAGLDEPTSRELTIAMLAALEGAFVLARALRDTEPLRVAGEVSAERVSQALAGPSGPSAAGPGPPPTAARVRPRLRARWPDHEEREFPGPASP